jgi:hypothetical protein
MNINTMALDGLDPSPELQGWACDTRLAKKTS